MTEWSFDENRQVGELMVAGAININQVAELKTLLIEAISQAPLVLIDLDQVREADVAGLQLFCAAHRLAANSGKTLKVKAVSECVRQLVHAAGFAHAAVCDSDRKNACLWEGLA